MKTAVINFFHSLSCKIGLELSRTQLEAFGLYGDFLIDRNKRDNLTAIDDEYGIVVKHFFDSLTPAVYVRELADIYRTASVKFNGGGAGRHSLLDVGAGAGFPGIPLKILYGEKLEVTLIDSTMKKVKFMNDAIAMLGLTGCKAVHIRAEDASKDDGMRGKFDFATARALAPLSKIIEYTAPLLTNDGILIAMKGRRESVDKELAQLAFPDARQEKRKVRSRRQNSLLKRPHAHGTLNPPPVWAASPRVIGFVLDAAKQPDYGMTNGENNGADAVRQQYERTLVIMIKRFYEDSE